MSFPVVHEQRSSPDDGRHPPYHGARHTCGYRRERLRARLQVAPSPRALTMDSCGGGCRSSFAPQVLPVTTGGYLI